MNINREKYLAKCAGRLGDYRHHLDSVDHPLKFVDFERMDSELRGYLARDPDGNEPQLTRVINNLCLKLGY